MPLKRVKRRRVARSGSRKVAEHRKLRAFNVGKSPSLNLALCPKKGYNNIIAHLYPFG